MPISDAKWMPEPFSGCWLWIGATSKTGYGVVWTNRHTVLAHRLSWTVHRGNIPNGLHVLHSCDTRACINPDHLFLGTNKDNVEDCARKGRRNQSRFGESHFHKVTLTQVRLIRIDNRKQKDIAKAFNISTSQVSRIKAGIDWSREDQQ